ncbi:MAG: hypothetical protein EXR99_11225 [Gemmataceae bacterium]|nr:hypothetical protein [Gemmataceae bacterium]
MKKIFALTLSLAWFVVPAFADEKPAVKTDKKIEPTPATQAVEKRFNLGKGLLNRTTVSTEASVPMVQKVRDRVSSTKGSLLSGLRSENRDGLRVLRGRKILGN